MLRGDGCGAEVSGREGSEDEHKHLGPLYLTTGPERLSGAPQRKDQYIIKDDRRPNYTIQHKLIEGQVTFGQNAEVLIINKMLGKIGKSSKCLRKLVEQFCVLFSVTCYFAQL